MTERTIRNLLRLFIVLAVLISLLLCAGCTWVGNGLSAIGDGIYASGQSFNARSANKRAE